MPLADTGKAIGKVSELLQEHLGERTGIPTTVGRTEPPQGNSLPKPRLNLFLYEASPDPSLRNTSLDEGQLPPIWLVLKYLLTAYDEDGDSDSTEAHASLGEGLRALQEISHIPFDTITLPSGILPALEDNPETLKISFEYASSELLSKLMQGADEKYRFSVNFEVRPVMIATDEPPSYSLLVGVDYTAAPPEIIGLQGVQNLVIPSMGPRITRVEPVQFEVNDTLTISGSDLGGPDLCVAIGEADLPVTAQRPGELDCLVDGGIASGDEISAGGQALAVVKNLPTGRKRSSNLLVAGLRPTLDTAVPGVFNLSSSPPNIFGPINMTGLLLGTSEDDIFVALYKDEEVIKTFDRTYTSAPDQTTLILNILDADAIPPGTYRLILRVNGLQARMSPTVTLA